MEIQPFFPAPESPARLAWQRTRCNALTARSGLALTPEQFLALREHQREVLWETGRVEFGEGILPQLAHAFCDSPYLGPREWAAALWELTGIFYHYKNECGGALDDDALVAAMRGAFNGPARGSLDYLAHTSLEALCRLLRGGEGAWDAGTDAL